MVRQFKLPAGLSSVDAANCYDSVAHAIAALTFRAFVPKEAIHVMLQTIEEMKYSPRTAYGDSKRFRGSKMRVKFQGLLCQGNGTAPAGWAVISIVILGSHKRK